MDLSHLVVLVRRRAIVIAVCLAAGVAGGYYLGHHSGKTYTASARAILGVSLNPRTSPSVSESLQAAQLTNNDINTYASVATSLSVAKRIISNLGLQATPAEVSRQLSAAPENLTSIIDVTASASTPRTAQAMADAAVKALASEIKALEAGNPIQVHAEPLDPAQLPTSPSAPRPTLDLTVGILLGLLAGLAAAAILEGLDRTLKTSVQGETLFGVPLIGAVPRRRGALLVVGRDKDRPEGEPYRTLRTAVRFLRPDRPIRTLLVTSGGSGEGKTTTAANLAVAIALSGERVVVVDADLRRAGLARAFGIEHSVGLTSLVLGTATLDEALQTWDRGVQVLPTGPLPPNPSEILGSQLFNHVLRSLTDIADIVIIDAPPLLPVTDALALSVQVDGVLIVARYGVTLRAAASETRSRLDGIGADVVGYVLNAIPSREAKSYHAEYYYKPSDRQTLNPPRGEATGVATPRSG